MGPQLKLIVTTKQKKRAKMVPNSPLAPLAPTLRLLRRLGLCPLKLGSPVQGWECAASASAWLSAALAGSALALFLPFGDAGDALKVLLSLQERLGSNSTDYFSQSILLAIGILSLGITYLFFYLHGDAINAFIYRLEDVTTGIFQKRYLLIDKVDCT